MESSRDSDMQLATPAPLLALVDLADADLMQAFHPDFDDDGDVILQPGERVLLEFDADRIGFGMDRSPLRSDNGVMHRVDGKCIATSCRLVYVCKKWNTVPELGRLGRSTLAYIDSMALSDAVSIVNRVRARRARRGVVLAAQIRWPWLASIAYVQRGGLLSLATAIEFQCVQRSPAVESGSRLYLGVGLPGKGDVTEIIQPILDAVKADRCDSEWISAAKSSELTLLKAGPGEGKRYTQLMIPGALMRSPGASRLGNYSSVALDQWADILRGAPS